MNALETLNARSARRESRRDRRFAAPSWELDIEGRRLASVIDEVASDFGRRE